MLGCNKNYATLAINYILKNSKRMISALRIKRRCKNNNCYMSSLPIQKICLHSNAVISIPIKQAYLP